MLANVQCVSAIQCQSLQELNLWHYWNKKYYASLPATQQLKSLWRTTSEPRYCHFLEHTVNMRSCNILEQYDWHYSFSKYKSSSGTVLFSPFSSNVLHRSLLVKQYCLFLYTRNSSFFCLGIRTCSWQPSYTSAMLLQNCCNLHLQRKSKVSGKLPKVSSLGTVKEAVSLMTSWFFLPLKQTSQALNSPVQMVQ